MHPSINDSYRFNVLRYGADPTGTVSSSAAIQAAMDAADAWMSIYANIGATVYIPEGRYYITTGINLRSFVHVKCEPGALFYFPNGYVGNMWQNLNGERLEFATVEGGFYGNGAMTRTWNCIHLESDAFADYIMFCKFSNIQVHNCNNAVNIIVIGLGWANGNTFENFMTWQPNIGIRATQAAGANGLGNNLFDKWHIQTAANTTYCIYGERILYNNFTNIRCYDVIFGVTSALTLDAASDNNTFIGTNWQSVSSIVDASPGNNNMIADTIANNLKLGVYEGDIVAAIGITATMIMRGMIVFIGAAAVDITANPQIVAGKNGQIIVILGRSNANTLTLDNGTGLALSAQWIGGLHDSITLVYSTYSALWIELSRSNN